MTCFPRGVGDGEKKRSLQDLVAAAASDPSTPSCGPSDRFTGSCVSDSTPAHPLHRGIRPDGGPGHEVGGQAGLSTMCNDHAEPTDHAEPVEFIARDIYVVLSGELVGGTPGDRTSQPDGFECCATTTPRPAPGAAALATLRRGLNRRW
jgi:hypothetical protein